MRVFGSGGETVPGQPEVRCNDRRVIPGRSVWVPRNLLESRLVESPLVETAVLTHYRTLRRVKKRPELTLAQGAASVTPGLDRLILGGLHGFSG